MRIASAKVFVGLSNTQGRIPNPPDWLSEVLLYKKFAETCGWTVEYVDSLDIEIVASFQGIWEAENKKAIHDNMKARNAGRKGRR